jgi:iron(III) transport system ATP-binding protein
MSLKIENLQFRYKANRPLIEHVSLTIETGKITAIVGDSGCGKSTLVSLIAGFIKPQQGMIIVHNKVLNQENTFVAIEDRGLGVVFQDYALFPHLTVIDNIAFGIKQKNQNLQRVGSLLSLFNLGDVAYAYPFQLSGGQMQRVAIARALAIEPHMLLLDEPFSNLDQKLTVKLRQELAEIIQKLSITTLLVTHDLDDAKAIAHQTFSLPSLMK